MAARTRKTCETQRADFRPWVTSISAVERKPSPATDPGDGADVDTDGAETLVKRKALRRRAQGRWS